MIFFRSHRRSASQSSDDVAAAMGITRLTSITELNDLAARKKAEVDRLAELERERIQLLYVNFIIFNDRLSSLLGDRKKHVRI